MKNQEKITFTDTGIVRETITTSSNQDYWEEDRISLTGNPFAFFDTLSFKEYNIPGGLGDDHITFKNPTTTISDNPNLGCYKHIYPNGTVKYTLEESPLNFNMDQNTSKNGFWKYEEDKTLKAVEEYLVSTYKSHYTSEQSKTQTLDLIESIGDAEPFTRSNAIKYLSRFGKKNGKSKQDILKAIHYCVLLYHFAGLHKNTTDRYETF
jgi:hypothetical protein